MPGNKLFVSKITTKSLPMSRREDLYEEAEI